jgi:hypothetical protein
MQPRPRRKQRQGAPRQAAGRKRALQQMRRPPKGPQQCTADVHEMFSGPASIKAKEASAKIAGPRARRALPTPRRAAAAPPVVADARRRLEAAAPPPEAPRLHCER